jgi:hypothetical protein
MLDFGSEVSPRETHPVWRLYKKRQIVIRDIHFLRSSLASAARNFPKSKIKNLNFKIDTLWLTGNKHVQ